MRQFQRGLLGVLLFACGVADAAPSVSGPSDSQIRKILIEESREAYTGNCPCPYDTDRAGRSCGKRSAYSRPGGEAPLCYERDVTKEMVEAYKRRSSK